MSRMGLFSICRRLFRDYLIAGGFQIACSNVKNNSELGR